MMEKMKFSMDRLQVITMVINFGALEMDMETVLHVGKFIKDRDGLQIVASFEEENTYAVQGLGYGCQVIDNTNRGEEESE